MWGSHRVYRARELKYLCHCTTVEFASQWNWCLQHLVGALLCICIVCDNSQFRTLLDEYKVNWSDSEITKSVKYLPPCEHVLSLAHSSTDQAQTAVIGVGRRIMCEGQTDPVKCIHYCRILSCHYWIVCRHQYLPEAPGKFLATSLKLLFRFHLTCRIVCVQIWWIKLAPLKIGVYRQIR